MNKDDVVKSLVEMADLLEIVEASRFEVLAFRNAASALDDWPGDLQSTVANGTIEEIPTIGKGTAKVITELTLDSTSEDLENIRSQVPDELPKLLRFRGLGAKKVRLLWNELQIESPADLEKAINDGQVVTLKGFGAKTIETMRASLDYYNSESKNGKFDTDKPEADNSKRASAAVNTNNIQTAVAPTGSFFAGTSGYSYTKWKGTFFPLKAKTSELLTHYSQQLTSVEINNTFYRFPSEAVVQQWKAQTPENFQFSLKAHRRITHQMRLNEGSKARIQEFIARCSVLEARLGCILFQLPPDFERDDSRLHNLLSALPAGPRYAIEFRHDSWFNDNKLLEPR